MAVYKHCRCCLKYQNNYVAFNFTDSESKFSVSAALRLVVPELNQQAPKKAVICTQCYALLILSYNFRLQTFKTENIISAFRKKDRHIPNFSEEDLAEVAKLIHNTDGTAPEPLRNEEEIIKIIEAAEYFLKGNNSNLVINENDLTKQSVESVKLGENGGDTTETDSNSEKYHEEKTIEHKNEELDAGNYIRLPQGILTKHYLKQSELWSSVNTNVSDKENQTYRLEPGEVLPLTAKLTPVKYKIDRNLSDETLKDSSLNTSGPKSDEKRLSRPSEDVNSNTEVKQLIPTHNSQLDCSSTTPPNSSIASKTKPKKRQSKAKIKAIEEDPNVSRKGRRVSKKSINKRKTKSLSPKEDMEVENNNTAISKPPDVSQETLYENLDIKKEPLYAEDYLNFFEYTEEENHDMEWNNESLSSAFQSMDNIHNIDNIVDILPEIGDEIDTPEYVRINSIRPASFKDIKNQLSGEPVGTDKSPVKKDKKRSISQPGVYYPTYPIYSETGDYINDHDYLTTPYATNGILRRIGKRRVCVCWLCDASHAVGQHGFHMRRHEKSTTCTVCHVNFHNVFLLNIHVKRHYSYCNPCKTTVSYLSHHLHVKCDTANEESKCENDQYYKDIPDKNFDNQEVSLKEKVTGTKPVKTQSQQQLKPDKDLLNIRKSSRIAKCTNNKIQMK